MALDLSIGLVHSVHKICSMFHGVTVPFANFVDASRSSFSTVDLELVLIATQKLNYIAYDSNGDISLTASGNNLASFQVSHEYVRFVLRDYILNTLPVWAYQMPSGRENFRDTIKEKYPRVVQMMDEALLFDDNTDASVGWWDGISNVIRGLHGGKRLEIGRIGEKLTIAFEKGRVGKDPEWVALNSNYAGFDVLSWMDSTLTEKMPIEVKCTTLPIKQAKFYLSKNEWRQATQIQNYRLYLWQIIGGNAKVCEVDAKMLTNEIPQEPGCGEWESSSFPFHLFFKKCGHKELEIKNLI